MHFTFDTHQLFYIGMGSKKRALTSRNRNQHWNKIVAKHGKPSVLIIADGLTMEQAAEIEKFWIRHHGLERLANISPGGDGIGGFTHTEETRKKIAEAGKGRKHSNASKAKMRVARLGKPITKENVAKIIKANTGRKRSDEHNRKLFESNRDKIIHNFMHSQHGLKQCTQFELRTEFNLKGPRLSELISGKRNSYHGWKLIIPPAQKVHFKTDAATTHNDFIGRST